MSDAKVWQEIKQRLHDRAEEFVRWLYPSAAKSSTHELCVGNLDGAPGDSLKICVSGAKVGVWRDFSGADGGNNLLDLLIKARGLEFGEGLKLAAEWLGMALPAPAPRERTNRPLRFVCAYDYTTPAGELVHQTLRFHYTTDATRKVDVIDPKTGSAEKTFRQRRPAAPGMMQGRMAAKQDREGHWWLWTLEGIEPVLYHLPAIAANPEADVWIVEGEKDADALAARGLVATTCPMGAGKWRPSYTEALRGRRVVLCGDSDEAGRAGMEKVGAALEPVCELVEVVDWPSVLGSMRLAERAGEKWDAAKYLSTKA